MQTVIVIIGQDGQPVIPPIVHTPFVTDVYDLLGQAYRALMRANVDNPTRAPHHMIVTIEQPHVETGPSHD